MDLLHAPRSRRFFLRERSTSCRVSECENGRGRFQRRSEILRCYASDRACESTPVNGFGSRARCVCSAARTTSKLLLWVSFCSSPTLSKIVRSGSHCSVGGVSQPIMAFHLFSASDYPGPTIPLVRTCEYPASGGKCPLFWIIAYSSLRAVVHVNLNPNSRSR